MNSTPRWASETSPGRGLGPPPTIAGADAPWCGARNGGTATSARPGGSSPATEWMRVTSSASSRVSVGRMPGSRRASIVFPVPGGPISRRLCEPRRRSRAHGALAPGRADRRDPGTAPPSIALRRRSARTSARRSRPRKYATTSARWRTGTGSIPASAASGADSAAHTSRVRPGAARPLGDRERAGDRTDAPVERELADGRVLCEPLRRELPRGGEHGERDRQIESGALLAQRGGREVDRDPPVERPLERRRDDAAPDAVLRLLARAVGETDDREPGNCRAGGAPRPRPSAARGRRVRGSPRARARAHGAGKTVTEGDRLPEKRATSRATACSRGVHGERARLARCRSRPTAENPITWFCALSCGSSSLRDQSSRSRRVVAPGRPARDRPLIPLAQSRVTRAELYAPFSAAPSTTLTDCVPHRDRADDASRAGGAGGAGGTRGTCRPLRAGRACGQLSGREVDTEQRPVRDLRRVDRVVADLRVRYRAVDAAAACRRCCVRAG